MKFHFPLTSKQQDSYGAIIDSILKYYPIGIKSDWESYSKYPGQIALTEIMIDNIHNRKNFKTRWKDFDKEIGKKTKKKIVGETYGLRPGYSSAAIVNRFENNELLHLKTLHYSVSLIGPFFTIYGIDETCIKDDWDGRNIGYAAINVVTVSPYKEFELEFNVVKSSIEDKFKGYKFIPFRLHSMVIDGLFDSYNDKELTIYEALFDHRLDGFDTMRIRGDSSYGYNEWIKNKIHVKLLPPPENNLDK
jgi:hypothetical protein